MLGPPIRYPLVWACTLKSSFCRDQQIFRIRMQGLGNNFLTYVRPVGIGRVDEIDSQLHGSAKNPDCLIPILRFAPDSLARDSHRSKAQAIYLKIAPNPEMAGSCRWKCSTGSRCCATVHSHAPSCRDGLVH